MLDGWFRDEHLWYLATPVGPVGDETLERNLEHGLSLYSFLLKEAKIKTVAPYFGLCFALKGDEELDLKLGVYMDFEVLAFCDGIIAWGPRMSVGMQLEWDYCTQRSKRQINLVGQNFKTALDHLNTILPS